MFFLGVKMSGFTAIKYYYSYPHKRGILTYMKNEWNDDSLCLNNKVSSRTIISVNCIFILFR